MAGIYSVPPDGADFACPRGLAWGAAEIEGVPANGEMTPVVNLWGPTLWAELHRRPWECPDLAGGVGWLAAFALRVLCGDCRGHWLALVAAHPPDLSSQQAYSDWTVARRGNVNARLGKPQWRGINGPSTAV